MEKLKKIAVFIFSCLFVIGVAMCATIILSLFLSLIVITFLSCSSTVELKAHFISLSPVLILLFVFIVSYYCEVASHLEELIKEVRK